MTGLRQKTNSSPVGHNVHLVIRSTGERTTGVARQLALQTLPEKSVTVVEEAPFEQALRATYLAGIGVDQKWTMTLDADVLLRPGAIEDLLREAERMPAHYAQVEGHIFDKITGRFRQAGQRIYRTALLPLALTCIPENGSQLRPEYFTLTRLREKGHPSHLSKILMGLHDFEQYYCDLYRKSVVHAAKHKNMLGDIITRCIERRVNDSDYEVILKGLWAGLTIDSPVTIDSGRYVEQAERAIASLGLREKGVLNILFQDGETALDAYDRLTGGQFSRYHSQLASQRRNDHWLGQIRSRFKQRGPIKGALSAFGAALKHVGARLDAM